MSKKRGFYMSKLTYENRIDVYNKIKMMNHQHIYQNNML